MKKPMKGPAVRQMTYMIQRGDGPWETKTEILKEPCPCGGNRPRACEVQIEEDGPPEVET